MYKPLGSIRFQMCISIANQIVKIMPSLVHIELGHFAQLDYEINTKTKSSAFGLDSIAIKHKASIEMPCKIE